MIDTYGAPGVGMMKRVRPDQQVTNYVGVPSVDEYAAKVGKLSGKIIVPKIAIPGIGYFVNLHGYREQCFRHLGDESNGELIGEMKLSYQ